MKTFIRLLIGGLAFGAVALAMAQPFPDRPIKMVVPFPPGGGFDGIARPFAERLSAALGQPVIVDNRPGAGGNIGAEFVARAPADGYTLLFANDFLGTNPNLYKDLKYDPAKDFAPISLVGSTQMAIAVNPQRVKATDAQSLRAESQAHTLQYGTPGVGTSPHLFGELYGFNTGTRVQHIPYRGTGPAINDVLGGQIDMVFSDTSSTLPDWRAYVGTVLQQTNSGVYVGGSEPNVRGNGHPYYASAFPGGQTAPALQQANYPQQTGALAVGTVGFAWRDVIISKTGSKVEWSIDGLKIAGVTNVSLAASNIFLGYWDSFTSLSDNTNLSFGLVDNVRVERFVTNVPPYLTSQPASVMASTGSNVPFTVAAGGTSALSYQWRFNGTNLVGATSSTYTRLNAQAIHAGNYSVVVTNSSGSVTSAVATLTLTPSIPLQFTTIAALPAGKVGLVLTGDPGFTAQLQVSTNLTDWSVLTNLANPTGTLSFTNIPPVGVPYQFFRAQYP